MIQTAKIFSMNTVRSGGTMIDNQINDYLTEHPTYRVKTVSYIMAGVFEKALVIFEYPEAKPQETKDSDSEPQFRGGDNGKHKNKNQNQNFQQKS